MSSPGITHVPADRRVNHALRVSAMLRAFDPPHPVNHNPVVAKVLRVLRATGLR